ncbi:MAG: penicillin-binding protein 2, partial [Treponema sp.]|nr:penicillin-binding protein 2 [Treponema sp.]
MKELPAWRFLTVIGLFAVVGGFVLVRYGTLAGEDGTARPAATRPTQHRGRILDRNGRVLAAEIRRFDVQVGLPPDADRELRGNLAHELAEGLSGILGIPSEELFWRIIGSPRDLVVARQLSEERAEAIRRAAQDAGLSGVSLVPVPFRVYPEGQLASQIVGFVGTEYGVLKGREGVEYAMNAALAGGQERADGNDVVLTIDARVQHILEQVSADVREETGAESVMFLAMDPRSGDILGSAVVPGFDPNNRGNDPSLYRNLTALEQFEPGSVFKVFSIAALLDAGIISPQTEFFCNGLYERVFPGGEVVRISCADGIAHGRVTAREIITLSCNVGAASAAERYSDQLMYRDLQNMGFGASTGGWVNAETRGRLADPQFWSGRSRQSIAFGQEIAVSALQMMQAAGAIANGGILTPPRIVKDRENPGNERRRVMSERTARLVLGYMRDTATTLGTGWRADMPDLNLAVKTGTSQILSRDGGYIASTLAMLPAENPSLILYVVIVRPQ